MQNWGWSCWERHHRRKKRSGFSCSIAKTKINAIVFTPQATKKFFGAAVFQKCCRGVSEQPTFAKQMKLYNEMEQKSKRELEESQLPSKQKVEMMEQGFRGNCDSQASWGCAPALPNRIREVSLRVIHTLFHMKHHTKSFT